MAARRRRADADDEAEAPPDRREVRRARSRRSTRAERLALLLALARLAWAWLASPQPLPGAAAAARTRSGSTRPRSRRRAGAGAGSGRAPCVWKDSTWSSLVTVSVCTRHAVLDDGQHQRVGLRRVEPVQHPRGEVRPRRRAPCRRSSRASPSCLRFGTGAHVEAARPAPCRPSASRRCGGAASPRRMPASDSSSAYTIGGRGADRRLRAEEPGRAAGVVRVARPDRRDLRARCRAPARRRRSRSARTGSAAAAARCSPRSRRRSSSRSPRRCSPTGSRGRTAGRTGSVDGKIVGWLIWVKPPAACTSREQLARRARPRAAATSVPSCSRSKIGPGAVVDVARARVVVRVAAVGDHLRAARDQLARDSRAGGGRSPPRRSARRSRRA